MRCELNKALVMELPPRFLDTFSDLWPFSPDLRHFRRIMAAVKFESIEMSEARAGKP
jgi:hypothetical protein